MHGSEAALLVFRRTFSWTPALLSKRWTPRCGQVPLARGTVQGDQTGHLLGYSDEFMRQQQGSAAAAAMIEEAVGKFGLQYVESSATDELVDIGLGLHLLQEPEPAPKRCVLLCYCDAMRSIAMRPIKRTLRDVTANVA